MREILQISNNHHHNCQRRVDKTLILVFVSVYLYFSSKSIKATWLDVILVTFLQRPLVQDIQMRWYCFQRSDLGETLNPKFWRNEIQFSPNSTEFSSLTRSPWAECRKVPGAQLIFVITATTGGGVIFKAGVFFSILTWNYFLVRYVLGHVFLCFKTENWWHTFFVDFIDKDLNVCFCFFQIFSRWKPNALEQIQL